VTGANEVMRARVFAAEVRKQVVRTTAAEIPHFLIDRWRAAITIEALLNELERVESELQIARGL
jgi:hypothetical protein